MRVPICTLSILPKLGWRVASCPWSRRCWGLWYSIIAVRVCNTLWTGPGVPALSCSNVLVWRAASCRGMKLSEGLSFTLRPTLHTKLLWVQSWQKQLHWRALFVTLLCSNDYSASKLCVLQEWWGLGLSVKICYNEQCCFHPSLANGSEDVPKIVVFVIYVLQFKSELFMILSLCHCCRRNSVLLLRCSESSL